MPKLVPALELTCGPALQTGRRAFQQQAQMTLVTATETFRKRWEDGATDGELEASYADVVDCLDEMWAADLDDPTTIDALREAYSMMSAHLALEEEEQSLGSQHLKATLMMLDESADTLEM